MKWMNTFAFFVMILVNILVNILRLGGNTTAEVSHATPTLVTPAPYTFAIWSVIYVLMLAFIISRFRYDSEQSPWDNAVSDNSPWFVISCLLNICWIVSWHYSRIGLSLLAMGGLIISLIIINTIYTKPWESGIGAKLSIIGFQVYLGWICAASFANAAVFLKQSSWNRFGLTEESWAVIILFIGMLLGIGFKIVSNKPFALLAIVWAYVGIFVNHIARSGYALTYPAVSIAVMLMVGIMVFILLPITDISASSAI